MSPQDEFAAEVFRYLDGELSAEEAQAFERRIDEDEVLEREFRAIAEVDLLESLASPAVAEKPGGQILRWLKWGSTLIAASTLAFVALRGLAPSNSESVRARVALLRLVTSQEDYNALLGLDPDWLPKGNGTLGVGGSDDDRPTPEEYAERVRELERERHSEAFERADEPLVAGRYAVLVHVEEDAYALIVSVSESAGMRLLWPREDEPTRLAGGSNHVLPRESVELGAPGDLGVAFDPGFLRPLDVGEEVLLVALRGEPTDSLTELRAELSNLAPEGPLADRVEAASATLKRMGWSVEQRSVRE